MSTEKLNTEKTKNILNYIKINKNISTSGQPSPAEFKQIAATGFTSVINLAMPDSTNALPDEGGLVSEQEMNYFHIPVAFDKPTIEHLHLFLKLMEITIDEQSGDLETKKKVWVHCALNWRVSAFMYHYQKNILKLADAEHTPMLDSWKPDEIWKDFLALETINSLKTP